MRYVSTLSNLDVSEVEEFGLRATDLALLKDTWLNIPLTFVIKDEAFEEFVKENGLKHKIERMLSDKGSGKAFPGILELFGKASFPSDMEEEITEAYESLSIDKANASSLITEDSDPLVSITRSPSYILPTDDTEGMIQHLKGKEALLAGIKWVWASFFSPESIKYRKNNDINSFSSAIIVQRMKSADASAVCYSKTNNDEKVISIKSFFGIQDYGFDEKVSGKDYAEVDKASLLVKRLDKGKQEFSILSDTNSDSPMKKVLRESGENQKLNDKILSELARITKRVQSVIGNNVKLYAAIKGEYSFVLTVSRMVKEKPTSISFEPDEKTIDKKDSSFEFPDLVDEKKTEENKESEKEEDKVDFQVDESGVIDNETKPKEFSDAVYDIKDTLSIMIDDLEPPPKITSQKEEKIIEDSFEKNIEQETNVEEPVSNKEKKLLEEVLEITSLVEKMKSYADEENKEAYDKHKRLLRRMLENLEKEDHFTY
jgi:phosphoenolpyruvate synthase/pyruvate phosphate dikinase